VIIIDLTYNLALLVALSVVSGFIRQRWKHVWWSDLLQGMVFGGAAVIGMLRPLVLAPGLIFDGRSVMISLCGLFFGPAAVAVAAGMAFVCRIFQGGVGAIMGVLVISSSALLGIVFHVRWIREGKELSARQLFGFGLIVHVVMILLVFTLPGNMVLGTLNKIGWPVMLTYPLATVLIGKILSDQRARNYHLAALQESETRYRELVEHANSIILRMDTQGTITFFNEFAQRFFGFTANEILGKNVVGTILPTRDAKGKDLSIKLIDICENPERYLVHEKENIRKDGTRCWISWTNRAIRDSQGQCIDILCIGNDITQNKRAEDLLRESEEKFRLAFQTSPDSINLNRASDGMYIDINEGFTTIMGYTRDEVIGKTSLELSIWNDPGDRDRLIEALKTEGYAENLEARFRGKDGRVRVGLMSARLLHMNQENVILSITRDITDRKRAEEEREKLQSQLLQAQKMESIGRLAGGVAHDFNNKLQAILGYTDIALVDVGPDSWLRGSLLEIQKAAMGSADLTRQLLAFARKQTISPRVLDINDTVVGMLNLLRRLIGEDIDLVWRPGADIWMIRMDPTQIDQILVNLVVNGRDAITGIGNLTIETENLTIDETYSSDGAEFIPGQYVLLAVSDTGCGMSKAVQETLFEPFFTTKELGKGTGLGLSTVYGIVKQNEGFINVYSEPGSGTTFRIYLPRVQTPAVVCNPTVIQQTPVQGNETILLVEDDEMILDFGRIILERYGYTVLSAPTPDSAICLANGCTGPIHLLITDVVMPGMNGKDLKEKLQAIKPGFKCIFMSGYTANVIAHHGVLDEGIHFLQKPFSVKTLAEKVREILDDAVAGG